MSLNGNIMTFIEFQQRLSLYPIFSLQDVIKICGDFSYRQLDRWEKKGYLKKLKRGFYSFSTRDIEEWFLYYAANRIYAPSYVSLEMALRNYNFIPEEVFQVTSIGTKKTAHFETCIGNFRYHHIKPSLYWGYRLIEFKKLTILLAEPEKAVLDYFYFRGDRLRAAEAFWQEARFQNLGTLQWKKGDSLARRYPRARVARLWKSLKHYAKTHRSA